MVSTEINIPVPWGFIAAKICGSEDKRKVLMIHGFLDNSESFSELMPLLPKSYCYVAIDLPGHGKSSHFPRNIVANFLDLVITVRIVIRFLKENPIILIGHSFGGHIATVYAQLYPSEVSRLALIECSYFNFRQIEKFQNDYRNYLESACNSLTKHLNKVPTFTYEEGLHDFLDTELREGMTRKAAESLYKRNIIRLNTEKYRTGIDPLIKYTTCNYVNTSRSYDILRNFPIACPTLSIVGLHSKLHTLRSEILPKILSIYRNGVFKFVEGGHHPQSEVANIVASLLCDFLNQKCNL
ncbi:hypothetical protein RI129_004051 [Pyrocoelia pectoralis]|uniref:AB hydrolase-1 domain-containing protein n=1 Tax=Pyrocoelia pectoralis TaxID=417401 RepID=A0AAN7VTD9_9COLE